MSLCEFEYKRIKRDAIRARERALAAAREAVVKAAMDRHYYLVSQRNDEDENHSHECTIDAACAALAALEKG